MLIDRPPRPTVLVIGAGAGGILTTLHAVRAAGDAQPGVNVVVVDPDDIGGAAFSTTDDGHLLNVPAFGMSAFPDDPGHFARWRASETGLPEDPHEFAPRNAWRRYLTATVATALATAGDRVTLTHVRRTAVRIDRRERGVSLSLDDGTTIVGDALVVATGLPAPATAWAPESLQQSERFVADPWAPGALDRIRADDRGRYPDVLLVGTGLTGVDVATSVTTGARPDRFVHAISRSGLLPRRHADGLPTPVVPDVSDWGRDLRTIVGHARRLFADSETATGDWRPAADGVRYRLQELWGRLDERDRLEFLTSHAAAWGRLRHRIPGPTAQRIEGLLASGVLTVSSARVVDASALPGEGLRVQLSDGTSHAVGWVVNCTGPRHDVRDLGDRLIDDLLRPRPGGSLAVSATAGMGFRTEDGWLVGAAGHAAAPIWVLGALRRGELWESTAVPEIRSQAAALAPALVAAAADRGAATPSAPRSEGLPR